MKFKNMEIDLPQVIAAVVILTMLITIVHSAWYDIHLTQENASIMTIMVGTSMGYLFARLVHK